MAANLGEIKAQIRAIYNDARNKIRRLRMQRIGIYAKASAIASERKAEAVRKQLGL